MMESKGNHYRVGVVELLAQLLILDLSWIVIVAMDGE